MSFINYKQQINKEVEDRSETIKEILIETDIYLDLLFLAIKANHEGEIVFYLAELDKVRTELFNIGFFREGKKK
jgi:hypothetical protein